DAFPDYYSEYFKKYEATVTPFRGVRCVGPVAYTGQADVRSDIDNLKDALAGVSVAEAFMPATSPWVFSENSYYPTTADYIDAVGTALREEYQAILEAGFVLQVDDPGLIELLNEDPST